MGGRGAYWARIGETIKKERASDGIVFDSIQLGKKVGKHAEDFGLDASKEDDRQKFFEITKAILDNPSEKRVGPWRGQSGDVIFYIKGNDVVVVNSNGEYVTTLKNGVQNMRVKNARKQDDV